MLPAAVKELLRVKPQLEDLLGLLSNLTGRSAEENMREIQEHVAARVFFLLLGEVSDAPNFEILSERVARRLGVPVPQISSLVDTLVQAVLNAEAYDVGRRRSVRDLPYTSRREIYQRQGYRCSICGWDFRDRLEIDRTKAEAKPTLDHIVSYRLGGDHLANLAIVCGLCNSVKGACIHVGEHGRVWIGNHIYLSAERTAAFWTFIRDRGCRSEACHRGAATTRFYAVRLKNRGPWTLDNLLTYCEEHRRDVDAIRY